MLDSGHHLGAVAALAYLHENNTQLCFDFDKLILNADLEFENKEFITSCAISRRSAIKISQTLKTTYSFWLWY